MTHKLTALLLGILLLGTLSCSDLTSPSSGSVNVLLTDAPIDLSTVHAVNVTLDEIVLFEREEDDDGGMEMGRPGVSAGEGLTVNLLDYQDGATVVIASLDVPAGDYQKVRMIVSEAHLLMQDPDDPTLEIMEPIFVPSSKVDVPVTFTVSGGETTDVTIDFDAELSVQVNETGNHRYILRPVIVPVGVASY